MTADQLRKSILQQAIQGKLVPQDPNDEPASVLLERIREEKARLVKEKKIKKEKNPSIIFRGEDNSHYEKFTLTGEIKCIDDEIPFDLPKGWEWCRIKDICQMQAGKNISASEILEEKNLEYQYRCIGGNGLRGYVKLYNTEGHFSIVGRQGALCGCLNIEEGRFYATEHAVIVDTWGIITPLFMYYILTALNLNQYSTATAQPGLSVAKIIETPFPLPPLSEQQRIVAKIEELMPLVEHYGKAQSELEALNSNIREQLKKSVLQYAIEGKLVPQCEEDGTAEDLLLEIQAKKQRLYAEGKLKKKDLVHSTIFRGEDNKYFEKKGEEIICIDEEIPFDIPNSWKWVRLADLSVFLSRGKSPKYSDIKQIPVFAQKCNLKSGGISLDEVKFLDASTLPKWKDEYKLRHQDILVNSTGTGTVGRVGVFSESLLGDYPFIVPDSHISVVRLSSACNPLYIFEVLSSYAVQNYIEDNLAGSTNQKELYIGTLGRVLLPLPPLAEQKKIVHKIEEVASIMSR
ncbi:EcoKI restriction-modification system protein HsdS [Porphyromonas crevioricanis]|uniref:EcoKI restriction-modification system protein HsdS n=1 Tax=Porphyromonas crevioricanis TaxID=393921 RepID=A0A2X4PFH5_9PORP|nr:restriction endonuclease subunit S [Porphyromonas crevioricanis]GAD07477.1 type I restriction-modification system, specificity subunit S [Porphyromonas crevioricanis JCM 13913]SQH72656.1 EcoKI restriction-modification system protein HsdS [Porphyromonas crevioricanis]